MYLIWNIRSAKANDSRRDFLCASRGGVMETEFSKLIAVFCTPATAAVAIITRKLGG